MEFSEGLDQIRTKKSQKKESSLHTEAANARQAPASEHQPAQESSRQENSHIRTVVDAWQNFYDTHDSTLRTDELKFIGLSDLGSRLRAEMHNLRDIKENLSTDSLATAADSAPTHNTLHADLEEKARQTYQMLLLYIGLRKKLGLTLPEDGQGSENTFDRLVHVIPLGSAEQIRTADRLIRELVLQSAAEFKKHILTLRQSNVLQYDLTWEVMDSLNRMISINRDTDKIPVYEQGLELRRSLIKLRLILGKIDPQTLESAALITRLDGTLFTNDEGYSSTITADQEINVKLSQEALSEDQARVLEGLLTEEQRIPKWKKMLTALTAGKSLYAGIGSGVAVNAVALGLRSVGVEADIANINMTIQMVSSLVTAASFGGAAYLRGRLANYYNTDPNVTEQVYRAFFRGSDKLEDVINKLSAGRLGVAEVAKFSLGYAFGSLAFNLGVAGIDTLNSPVQTEQLTQDATTVATPSPESTSQVPTPLSTLTAESFEQPQSPLPTPTPEGVEPTHVNTHTSGIAVVTTDKHHGEAANPSGEIVPPPRNYRVDPNHHGEFPGDESFHTVSRAESSALNVGHSAAIQPTENVVNWGDHVSLNGQMVEVPHTFADFESTSVIRDPNDSNGVWLIGHQEPGSADLGLENGDYAIHLTVQPDANGKSHLVIDAQGFALEASGHAAETLAAKADSRSITTDFYLKPITDLRPGEQPPFSEDSLVGENVRTLFGTGKDTTVTAANTVRSTTYDDFNGRETVTASEAQSNTPVIDVKPSQPQSIDLDNIQIDTEKLPETATTMAQRLWQRAITTFDIPNVSAQPIETAPTVESTALTEPAEVVTLKPETFNEPHIWHMAEEASTQVVTELNSLPLPEGHRQVSVAEVADGIKDWTKATNLAIAEARNQPYQDLSNGDQVVSADTFASYDEMMQFMTNTTEIAGVVPSPAQAEAMAKLLYATYSSPTAADQLATDLRTGFNALPAVGGGGLGTEWSAETIARNHADVLEGLFDRTNTHDQASTVLPATATQAEIQPSEQPTTGETTTAVATQDAAQKETATALTATEDLAQAHPNVDSLYGELRQQYPQILERLGNNEAGKNVIHYFAEHVMTEPYEQALQKLQPDNELKLAVLGHQAQVKLEAGIQDALHSQESPITPQEATTIDVSDVRLGLSPAAVVLAHVIEGDMTPVTVNIAGRSVELSVAQQNEILARALGNPQVSELLTPVNGQLSAERINGAFAAINIFDPALFNGNDSAYRIQYAQAKVN
jgi:hypothetical protein